MENEIFRDSQTPPACRVLRCKTWRPSSYLEESYFRSTLRNKLPRIRRSKAWNKKRHRKKVGSIIMKKITALIEKGADGLYSVYIATENFPYGVIGTGSTVNEALEDWHAGLQEMKEYVESNGDAFPEVQVEFKYDIPSFLQEYAYAFSLAGLERITGVNQKQLGHYISGYRRPSAKTIRKIESGIHSFSQQLAAVKFI